MPKVYGMSNDKKGLLSWEHVRTRMNAAKHYWICTVRADGRPHATPVDGLWLDDVLYFGGHPDTRWRQNLASNPYINVHLESASDVVILRGRARPLSKPTAELKATLAKASKDKYGYGPPPEAYDAGGVYSFRASVVLAWEHFPKDATRWQFQDTDND
jgi:nitroimidazol reductase NimA-like FMN-containing flavoprotein (pyridoxamine 5'-phosphate oxidase superfamily)